MLRREPTQQRDQATEEMAASGANIGANTPGVKVETRTWVLQAETELRFDVSSEHTLTVVVSFGRAEGFDKRI